MKPLEYEDLARSNAPFMAELEKVAAEVLRGGGYILGNRVAEFESAFARYCGAAHCVGVASGLDALLLSLKVLDLPPSSEVIVPSNTYIATILAVLQAGLKPVLVEPDLRTYNLNPSLLASAISAKTKAVLVVHLYGKPCDMDPILQLAAERDLKVIEDCAQAQGATYKGRPVGSLGDAGAFSFCQDKIMTTAGEGGMLTTNLPSVYEAAWSYRDHGRSREAAASPSQALARLPLRP